MPGQTDPENAAPARADPSDSSAPHSDDLRSDASRLDASRLDDLHPVRMIDVGAKAVTARRAVASGTLTMTLATMERVRAATLPKGNALEVARVAAIMAAKNTPAIVPLCHPLLLSGIDCDFELRASPLDPERGEIVARVSVKCAGQTGVEMEALCGACAALLTLYDMTKGIDQSLEIQAVRLIEKTGGKSDLKA